MQPDNPIVGGITLRIPAIRSPDYVAGVSGWTINVDGTAEFNNVTIRGTFITGTVPGAHVTISNGQILVFDSTNTLVEQIDANGIQAIGTNGSKIVITPAVSSQAEILIYPPTGIPGVTTIAPADLLAFGQTPGSAVPVLEIDSPGFNAHGQSSIFLLGVSADGLSDPQIQIMASNGGATGNIQLIGHDWATVTTQGTVNMPMGRCGYVDSSANSAAVGAETVVMTMVKPRIRTGRAYEFVIKHTLATSVATVTTMRVRQNSAVGAVISDRFRVSSDTNFNSMVIDMGKIKNVTGTDDATKDAVFTLQAAAGTTQQVASATRFRAFELWDIGAAADFPNATPW